MSRQYLIFLSLLIVFTTACVNRNEVHLSSKNFESEVEQQQNLVFTFDRDLVPDSVIGNWDTIHYVKFTPDVNGRFKWNTKRELMFSPIDGFRPSSDYKAILTDRILKYTTGNLCIQKENNVPFHTPYLKLISASGYWSVSEKFPDAAKLSLTMAFNCDIEPSTLSSLLHVALADKTSAFTLNSTSAGTSLTVSIDSLDKNNIASVPVKIIINKGLKCVGSDYLTKEDQEFSMVVPSPGKMEITQAAGEYSGTEAMIHIYTNQAVEKSNTSQLITIDPKINFTVEHLTDGFYLKGPFTEGLSYQVKISKDLKGELGGKWKTIFHN
jgi:alpha-2-macroglobulin